MAVKFYIPIYLFNRIQQVSFTALDEGLTHRLLQGVPSAEEFHFLRRVHHPFVVTVFDLGTEKLNAEEADRFRRRFQITRNPEQGKPIQLTYLVSQWVDGDPLHEALKTYSITPSALVDLLSGFASALDYLHMHHQYLHCDVRTGNAMVRTLDNLPILIDFAMSKNLNFGEVGADEEIRIDVDSSLSPEEALRVNHPVRELLKDGSGTRDQIRQLLFPHLDLYQFGCLLGSIEGDLLRILPHRDHAYIRSLIEQLQDWDAVTKIPAGGLKPLVDKISGRDVYRVALEGSNGDVVVPLPNARSVTIPTELVPLWRNPSFRRLGTINQLSLLPLLLPGAEHKRLIHSLDTLRIAKILAEKLQESPLFRRIFDARALTQLLAIALVHDINHFPFLHVIQESELPHAREVNVLDVMCDGVLTGEKRASGDDVPNGEDQKSIYELIEDLGIDKPRFTRLLLKGWGAQTGDSEAVDQVIRSTISSGVDVDKLAYLALDREMAGIQAPLGLAVDEFLSAASVCRVAADRKRGYHLAFAEDVLPQLEAVMLGRFWSFQHLYWRNENRGLMACVLNVVRDLYGPDGSMKPYVQDTIGKSDLEALRYLDNEYKAKHGKSPGLAALATDPSRFPVLLLADRDTYEEAKALKSAGRSALEQTCASELRAHLGMVPSKEPFDVVIDIPVRSLTSGGPVYIFEPGSSEGRMVDEKTSPAIDTLDQRFRALSHTVRVFGSAQLWNALSDKHGADSSRMRDMVYSVLQSALEASQVS